MQKIIIIDNYDSFTFTIQYYLKCLGKQVDVFKNDDPCLKNIEALNPSHIVLSPGPGNPKDAGFTLDIIQRYYTKFPILGICLGHQCIAEAFGGNIVHAPAVMHGKLSPIVHTQTGLFKGLEQNFQVTRYHSLMVDPKKFPKELQVTAWTDHPCGIKTIMALQHKKYPVFGVQFHPEAVLSEYGFRLLEHFLR